MYVYIYIYICSHLPSVWSTGPHGLTWATRKTPVPFEAPEGGAAAGAAGELSPRYAEACPTAPRRGIKASG